MRRGHFNGAVNCTVRNSQILNIFDGRIRGFTDGLGGGVRKRAVKDES